MIGVMDEPRINHTKVLPAEQAQAWATNREPSALLLDDPQRHFATEVYPDDSVRAVINPEGYDVSHAVVFQAEPGKAGELANQIHQLFQAGKASTFADLGTNLGLKVRESDISPIRGYNYGKEILTQDSAGISR
jgi:hypothetical protein